jgi:hypothetical protein
VENGERLEDVARDEGIDPEELTTYVGHARAFADELVLQGKHFPDSV